MKKIIFLLILVGGLLVVSPKLALAANTVNEEIGKQLGAAGTGAGYQDPVDPRTTVANIIYIALGFLGTIFVVLMIYAGFLWMTAGGNEENVTKAKSLLSQAVIGLVIILAAYSITLAVVRLAKGQNLNSGTEYYIEQPAAIPCTGLSCP